MAHVSKFELNIAYGYRPNVKHMCLKGFMIVHIVLTKIIMWKRWSDSINTYTEKYPLQFTTVKGKIFKVVDKKKFIEKSARIILF